MRSSPVNDNIINVWGNEGVIDVSQDAIWYTLGIRAKKIKIIKRKKKNEEEREKSFRLFPFSISIFCISYSLWLWYPGYIWYKVSHFS